MTPRIRFLLITVSLASAAPGTAMAAGPVCDAVWHDSARNRDIPIRIRMPQGSAKAPVILFSHGLGGSLDGGTLWGQAWADAGFVVIHLQHPGSDRSILSDGDGGGGKLRMLRRMRSSGDSGDIGGVLRAAMTPEQLDARVADVKFVLDQLPKRALEGRCAITRIDTAHIGMSGHSFGAHTTQALAGQTFAKTTAATAEPRISASIAFSPSPPSQGSDAQATAKMAKPFFTITGTQDTTPAASGVSAADRERPFRAMPAGDKYLLVLNGATHADFSGNTGGLKRKAPSEHLRTAVIETSIAFWRWTLLGDRTAEVALDDPKGLESRLAAGDRLERR
ncbi:putative dienelactone hydrolase [Novosphingobium sp. Rr 2-17]|uniref:alpha/beta hydrolase family protein n=1 Tax=Novosphingobium sp. Rr 2-17 TaxID=555793 RepID=UPI00026984F8|nr:dienelactone hydrolase [Novosphingobium sp. Rr 2-17]EIZ80000.1 putative dienelactone hydrolase [Novosphingobium sp. Rr 2-17]